MQILENLEERLRENAAQANSYRCNVESARHVADRMPLIHVSGGRVSFDQVLQNSKGTLPTSEVRDYYSDDTRRTEQILDLQPSL